LEGGLATVAGFHTDIFGGGGKQSLVGVNEGGEGAKSGLVM